MELKEFVKLDADQVRRDKELMQLFVKFYEAAFSFIPNCVGCSFKSGFKKLKKYANSSDKNIKFDKTITIMEAKTFILKKQYLLKILSYKKDGVTYRKYGHAVTEDFAKELVKFGNTEVFAKLPSGIDMVVRLQMTDGTHEDYNVKSDEILSDEKESNNVMQSVIEEISNNDYKPNVIIVDSEDYYNSLNHQKELLPLYTEVKERTGKKAESNKKSDIIAFLIENEN